MRILFLDIDGVLNSQTYLQGLDSPKIPWLLPEASEEDWLVFIDGDRIPLLNQILEATGAKVVLSSTWRSTWGADGMQALLEKKGFVGDIIDITPRKMSSLRANEISWWLGEHPEVERFAILDDDFSLLYYPEWKGHWVRTFFDGQGQDPEGLQPEHVTEAIRILGTAS